MQPPHHLSVLQKKLNRYSCTALKGICQSIHPMLREINDQGISSVDLARLFKSQGNLFWGSLLEEGKDVPLHYFTSNNESINSGIAAFLNQDQIPETGITMDNEKEMIASIQKDPFGLGFCRMKDLLDMNWQNIPENIQLLSIRENPL